MADDNEKGKINLGKFRQQQQEQAQAEERAARRTETQLREEQKQKMEKERQKELASPKTDRQKKRENFFYHHKTKLIAGVLVLIVVAVLAKDLFFTPKTDMVIVLAGSRGMPSEITEQVTEQMTPVVGDLNGDGKTVIAVDAVLIASSKQPEPSENATGMEMQGDPQAEAAGMMKLMAVVAAGKEHLFLLDEDAYNYLTQGSTESGLFEPITLKSGEIVEGVPLEDTLLREMEYAEYMEGFKFYVRVPMKEEKPEQDHEEALRIIEEIKR